MFSSAFALLLAGEFTAKTLVATQKLAKFHPIGSIHCLHSGHKHVIAKEEGHAKISNRNTNYLSK